MTSRAEWIFGYGSLIWRPAFPFAERRWGFVRGFVRRFWQASPDHRGTPAVPGRVATLVPAPRHERCWGVAYQVPAGQLQSVLARLDLREVAGYRRRQVVVESGPGRAPLRPALLYTAEPGNPNFVGAAPLQAIAARVARCRGPSGDNAAYVLRLAEALRRAGVHDPELVVLARLVRGDVGADQPW